MKMYLLLRNNKQSGPHSAEELKSMGLKAYDLVWLEGKSAAWRYPCEIDELSAFAPAVDEQPFDRFYKKPSPAGATMTVVNGNNDNSRNEPTRSAPVPVPMATPLSTPMSTPLSTPMSNPMSTPMSSGKRIIYVTMPAGKSPAANQMPREMNRETSRELNRDLNRETKMTASYARAAIEDYAAPAATGQTITVENLPRRRSRKTTTITRFLSIGLCILALLAAGFFIGLSLNRDNLGVNKEASGAQRKMVANVSQPGGNAEKRVDNPPTIVHPTAQRLPASAVTTPSTSGLQKDPAVTDNATVSSRTVRTNPRTENLKTENPKTESRSTKDRSAHGPVQFTTAPSAKDSANSAAIPVIQREAVHRSDNTEMRRDGPVTTDKEAMKAALANKVSVGANTYSVGTFGGISDLQVTVTNRSAYPLDLVVVEVEYIQSNKKVFRTENLFFRNMDAGSALMLEAPKTSRGIKVRYKITGISCKELGLSGV